MDFDIFSVSYNELLSLKENMIGAGRGLSKIEPTLVYVPKIVSSANGQIGNIPLLHRLSPRAELPSGSFAQTHFSKNKKSW